MGNRLGYEDLIGWFELLNLRPDLAVVRLTAVKCLQQFHAAGVRINFTAITVPVLVILVHLQTLDIKNVHQSQGLNNKKIQRAMCPKLHA